MPRRRSGNYMKMRYARAGWPGLCRVCRRLRRGRISHDAIAVRVVR